MATCKANSGISITCEDLRRVGGTDKKFWVGFLSDLDTPFDLTQVVTSIDFETYAGLYAFEGRKNAHTGGWELAQAQGGNVSFTQTFVAKLFNTSISDDQVIQDLSVSGDIFIVTQNNNQEFFIFGAGNGLEATAATQNTGQTPDSDTTVTLTFSGSEKTIPLRFSAGTYAASLALLEGYEL